MSKTIVPNIDDPAQKILLQSMTSTYGRKSKKFMAIRAIINTRSGRSKDIWWAKQYQKVTTFPLIQRWERRKTRPNCKAGKALSRGGCTPPSLSDCLPQWALIRNKVLYCLALCTNFSDLPKAISTFYFCFFYLRNFAISWVI